MHFPANIAKLLRTMNLKNIYERLLLKIVSSRVSHRGFNAAFIIFFLSLAVLDVMTRLYPFYSNAVSVCFILN